MSRARKIEVNALGALAIGALAVGAMAIGALAIGRLAIGRLTAQQAEFRRLRIDTLQVGRIERLPRRRVSGQRRDA